MATKYKTPFPRDTAARKGTKGQNSTICPATLNHNTPVQPQGQLISDKWIFSAASSYLAIVSLERNTYCWVAGLDEYM